MKLDPRELRSAFGTFLTGVTVVTSRNEHGQPVGFTANAYTSVSLDPPLLLVCPAMTLSSYPVFTACERFAVNILADDQQDISNIFATAKHDRFSQVRWHPDDGGCPIVHGAAAHFSCVAHTRVDAGDHLVLVGRIVDFAASGATGLGYANGGYFSLGMERRAEALPRARRATSVGAIIENEGRVLLQETPNGWQPPRVTASGRTGALAAIESFLTQRGIVVDFGPVYSIYDDHSLGEALTWYRGSAHDDNTADLGRYVPVDELDSLRWATPALADMMRRYRLEHSHGLFGLYVGDDVEGDVHMFGEGPQT